MSNKGKTNVTVHVNRETRELVLSMSLDTKLVNPEKPVIHLAMSKEHAIKLGQFIIDNAEQIIETENQNDNYADKRDESNGDGSSQSPE